MLDKTNPEYEETKEWADEFARWWSPELSDYEKRPRVIE
jgi:hypothetical protein